MNNITSLGKRLVLRVVLLQTGCAALAGLVFWVVSGAAAGLSGCAGGLIAAVGTGVFGWRMFAPGVAPAPKLHRAMFVAESLKWCWYLLALWVTLARLKLMPLPLIIGLAVAQFGYFGLIRMKRGY